MPWFAVGAVLASAALHGVGATPVSAATLPGRAPKSGPDVARTGGPAHRPLITPPWPEFGQGAQSTDFTFSIAPGELSAVLGDFTRLTGMDVSLELEALGTLHSPGVNGRMSAERALQQLLNGTGVIAHFPDANHATLGLASQSESVDVVAARGATVSSPKYVLPVRDIPQTINIIPREVMETQAVTTLSEALRNVPGITMQAGEGGGASSTAGDMFNLRGFNASNSLFVDGVRDDGLIARDTFNMEQVEVYMGPTGTDVGRGTAAGYVNMQTKAPRMAPVNSATLQLGSADQKRMTADLNHRLPIRDQNSWIGRSAVRLNALWQDSGTPGRQYATRESRSIAPSVALGIDSPTRVTASGQIMRQANMPDYGVPGAAWRDYPLAPTTQIAPSDVNQTNFYGSPRFDYDHGSQNSMLVRVEHDVNRSITVRNQTRYNRTEREAVISAIQNVAAFNPDTNLVTLSRQGNLRQNRILSNITSLVARFRTGGLRHAATAGVEVVSERQDAPGLTGLGTKDPVDIFNPDVNAPVSGVAIARSGLYTNGGVDTVAAYASDAVDLTNRWQVSGAMRVERYNANFDSLAATGVRTLAGSTDSLVSGKAGALFRLTPSANLYASVATSKTPPGTANFTLSAQANNQNSPNVRPQESTNVEVGGKWDVGGGRLAMTASAFRTVNKNVIFTVDATAIPPIFNQDDEQLVKGAAVGATGRVTRNWDIFANMAYLDSESRSQNTGNNGRRLPLTPALSGSVWTTYRLPHGLTVGGGLRHTGLVYVNAANTIQVPSYRLLDLMAEYPVNSHLSLRMNVTNATNATYIRNVNNNGGRYNPGFGRAVLVTTSLRF